MKRLIHILIAIILLSTVVYSQRFCADSSIRIKYTFNYPSIELFNKVDTTGKNLFVGNAGGVPDNPLVIYRTSWGNEILWAKNFTLPGSARIGCFNTFDAPNGTVIGTGYYVSAGQSQLLLFRMDTNGVMLWAKRYFLTTGNTGYGSGSPVYKNIIVTDVAIYLTAPFSQSVVVKLDLNGNVLWSTNLATWPPAIISDAPFLRNDTLFTVHQATEVLSGQPDNYFFILSSYNPDDGAFLSSTAFKKIPDALTHGIEVKYVKLNTDNSLSLAGNVRKLVNGQSFPSEYFFNVILSEGSSFVSGNYYTSLMPVDLQYKYDYNSVDQHVFMLNSASSTDRYFVSFYHNKVLRSRRFSMPPTGTFRGNINIDEKENIHFGYTYRQGNQSILEHARISDLSAANTAGCFGLDYNIVQPRSINLSQETFTWSQINRNIVSALPVNLVEDSEYISTEVVCKQISYCDSIKINGDSTACMPGASIRFSIYLNPECLREVKWVIDTSFASVVSQVGDSAVILQFKKSGQFFLKALVNNCVIEDSMLITVAYPQSSIGLNKGKTELCPGDSLTLRVSPYFRTYLWQDGSNLDSFVVRAAGFFKIIATDSCGNILKDSIQIRQADVTVPLFDRYSICQNDSASLRLPSNFTDISWSPPFYGTLIGNTIKLFPDETTLYSIKATKAPGCEVEKTVTVERKLCPEYIYFPSAFTPNNDGLNDIFKPGVGGKLQSYRLFIYNRAGMLVFSSTDPNSGWDGKFKSVPQPAGVYVYHALHNFFNQPPKRTKGTVMLMR